MKGRIGMQRAVWCVVVCVCVCVCVRERERERLDLSVNLPVFYEENLGVGPASKLACNAAMGLQAANAIVSAMQVQDGAIGDRLRRCQPKGLQDCVVRLPNFEK